jgi:hypothetical protein
MMTTRLFSTGRRVRGLRLALPWLCLALFALIPQAQSGGSGNGGGLGSGISNGEEVTSLPVVDDTSGLTFVGGLRDLRSLGISLRGSGRVDVRRIDRTTFAVTLVGDYVAEVDRRALARGNVAVLFSGGVPYRGGFAVLDVAGSSTVVPSERIPLPLARLAASPRAQGDLLTLIAFARRGARTHIGASFAPERVTLTQRTF